MRSTASVEVEAIRERWAGMVNSALEHAQVAERVDHRSYERQGLDIEPTVKMGHASAAIERRASAEQIAAGKEPHAVTPRGQMNEAIMEKRGWASTSSVVRSGYGVVPPTPRACRSSDAGHVQLGPGRSAGDAIGATDQQRGRVRGGAGARPVTPARPGAGD